jgi:hypothetical protein
LIDRLTSPHSLRGLRAPGWRSGRRSFWGPFRRWCPRRPWRWRSA